jgi:hypothetical protein
MLSFIQVTRDGGYKTVYPSEIATGELQPVAWGPITRTAGVTNIRRAA